MTDKSKDDAGNDWNHARIHSKFPNETRVLGILEHCLDDFKPVTSLIDHVASKSSLYRTIADITAKGWLESDGKKMYKTTAMGAAELTRFTGRAPAGLVQFYPPLAKIPTPQHRAVIELALAAVVARRFKIRMDRHPTFVLAGRTLQWKTSAGMFLCYMLGLNTARAIVNLAVESGRSLWLRKSSTGDIAYKREILKSPLVVFDEFQASDSQTKKFLGIFIDGRVEVGVENDLLEIEPVPLITLNPRKGDSLEEELGLTTAQLRRSIVCNLSSVRVPDLALQGEEPLKEAKASGPLEVRKPKVDCTMYRERAYLLLRSCLNETGMQLVDLEMLLMLSTAMTGYFGSEEAMQLVFYDSLLLFETLGWTTTGWMENMTHTFSSKESRIESTILAAGVNLPVVPQAGGRSEAATHNLSESESEKEVIKRRLRGVSAVRIASELGRLDKVIETCGKVDAAMDDERAELAERLKDMGFPPAEEDSLEEITYLALDELEDSRGVNGQLKGAINKSRGEIILLKNQVSSLGGNLAGSQKEASRYRAKYENLLKGDSVLRRYKERYGEDKVIEAFEIVERLPYLRNEKAQLDRTLAVAREEMEKIYREMQDKLDKMERALQDKRLELEFQKTSLDTARAGSPNAILDLLPTIGLWDLDRISLRARKLYDRKLAESLGVPKDWIALAFGL